ncbi:ABC-type transport system involved in multi-copper enzyme maturation permease subunit [Streptosporangium becharense]|uniref:ABC-type transport system involved in multi-copper enzyme maturation permease subunit n=1 Tax=Streptosporangium becharense TaxID=1816182 RepID=A0A7W9ILL3_9ACTN|nr:hypothetical protein [Streptosporangium becharense]MBB2911784.1 ABC-type transport system involved in multi-copper enzyme maturation permease subunit [Streptosporangium becharense]MBB5822398.1 ABC-type transport system involved in multi-copper enzyme maturation permease subunit [Streptosporangium becharense]
MIATLRYEFLMQIRRPVMWIVHALVFAVLLGGSRAYLTLDMGFGDPADPKAAMSTLAAYLMSLMPVAYGCLLTDRLVRDRRLRVAAVLDTTPAGRTGRLAGKYLGACAATAVPILIVYLGRALVYAAAEEKPSALGWAAVILVTTVLPVLLFTGALALSGPLLMAPMLFRVLFVVYWLTCVITPRGMFPTPSRSLLSPDVDYMRFGLFQQEALNGRPYDPSEGAGGLRTFANLFDFARPVATPGTALLWAALMLAFTLVMLTLVRLRATRTEP